MPTTVGPTAASATAGASASVQLQTGAGLLVEADFVSLAGLRVGLIVNQTSVVDGRHLIDLVDHSDNVELAAIFAPEHGVRGIADAGEIVADTTDESTGVPIFSLFGRTQRPTAAMLAGVDVLVYDLQDVGARFYTYISTMGLAMQSSSEAGIPFVVLDRPNPLGGETVSGFVRDPDQSSFVSQYPIPSVYGMTAGELALAIKGEAWLGGVGDLDLRVVEMEGWDRGQRWQDIGLDWVAPSPGLPSDTSALVYPSTVPFEATILSYGKGTNLPFAQVGAPWLDGAALAEVLNQSGLPGVIFEPTRFTPTPTIAPNPRLSGIELTGVRVVVSNAETYRSVETGIHMLVALQHAADGAGIGSIIDRPVTFDLLVGTRRLRQAISSGSTAEEIIDGWADETEIFQELSSPYLLY
jgi:uncharacterized protein YbbC (DUF1343 family)